VARAKRTDRAEARRRYRAQLAAESGGEELDPAEAGAAEPSRDTRGPTRTPPRRPAAAPAQAPARPGIASAFRAAFRPANLREDLAALPQLLRHRSVWLPALITIGTTAVFLTTGGADRISLILAQYFIAPPPIGGIFLAGFLAPRASYLTGGFAGLVGAICFAILVTTSTSGAVGSPGGPATSPSPSAIASQGASTSPAASASAAASVSPVPSAAGSPQASPTPSGTGGAVTPQERVETIAGAFILSPLTGAFFGAAAAWYRRFLNLANPNRGARRPPPGRGKPRRR
jgi:hypothetical protein